DNPRLDTRFWKGSNPVRILIDRRHTVPHHFQIFGPGGKTLVFFDKKNVPQDTGDILYHEVSEDKPLIPQLLHTLWQEDIQSLIVEGGARTLGYFINSGSWDEARIINGPLALETGLAAPKILHKPTSIYKSGPDTVRILRNDSEYHL
ncbi:RibD family protein, partial [Robiginitalea sp.]|uniref:RibD family protein n=1 Tax=Robiginitalea sp. TaxID=1902411 RepID=UPI003C5EFE25